MDSWSSKIIRMSIENEQLLFENALCARVKRLREEREWTAEQMGVALGIPPERYRKYENRSPIPHYLIPRFSQIVDRTVEYVLTGKETQSLSARRQIKKSA